MRALLAEFRHNPLLWLLAFVPAVFAGHSRGPRLTRPLFVLSVLAIVPLAALLSRATESVAAKTGDAVGGLLNATLGNLTELVIALTALRGGQYTLVKASIAGAIVTNTLFMLGGSFFLGGLRHHVQEFNRASARLQAGLLFLATVALLVPSAIVGADSAPGAAVGQVLSVGLSVLLIAAYVLGLLFSLRTHRDEFASAAHEEARRDALAAGAGAFAAGRGHGAGGPRQRGLRRVGAGRVRVPRHDPRLRGLHRGRARRGRGGDDGGVLRRPQEPAGPERWHRPRERGPDRALRGPGAGAAQLRPWARHP